MISESLRWIGKIANPQTHLARRKLLEKSLNLKSPIARDGAILGISFLDDPMSIPALKQAIQREVLKSLVNDIRQVLDQLEEKREMSG